MPAPGTVSLRSEPAAEAGWPNVSANRSLVNPPGSGRYGLVTRPVTRRTERYDVRRSDDAAVTGASRTHPSGSRHIDQSDGPSGRVISPTTANPCRA